MKYDKSTQREQNAERRRLSAREPFRRQQVSRRLEPLDWAETNIGIRRGDIGVFLAAARFFDHVILVRATNPDSLRYVAQPGFYPKPIDCKAKTADNNAHINAHKIYSRTAGLVVDPTIVGPKAFRENKYRKALESWTDFLADKSPNERTKRVYRRRGTSKGFYSVDLDLESPHYGCLLISPDTMKQGFETADHATPGWRRDRMQYLHGDYDLYAVIDADKPDSPTLKNKILGIDNFYSPREPEIAEFINRGIGAPMIQHGEQYRYKHQGDKLYVFYPFGGKYQLDEGEIAIKDIFEVLYSLG